MTHRNLEGWLACVVFALAMASSAPQPVPLTRAGAFETQLTKRGFGKGSESSIIHCLRVFHSS